MRYHSHTPAADDAPGFFTTNEVVAVLLAGRSTLKQSGIGITQNPSSSSSSLAASPDSDNNGTTMN